jgi:hypothetical protein
MKLVPSLYPHLRARLILGVSFALLAPIASFAQTSEVPRPIVDLRPGTANYKVRLEAEGQPDVTMDITRTTKAVRNTWVLSEKTTTAGRIQTEELTVDKKTLVLRKRVFHGSDVAADLTFSGHNVTGMVKDAEDSIPINRDVGAMIFADGGGAEDILAALPLAKGYTVEFRNFNIGSQQVKSLQLRVADSETVSVPAGTFDTWKVLITSLDGASDIYGLWVDKRSHRVVKEMMSFPDFGAMGTFELLK